MRPRQCAICLDFFKPDSTIKHLPCDPRHNFHPACIDEWLVRNPKCPICNRPVTAENVRACRKFDENVRYIRNKDEDSILRGRKK